MKKSAYVVPAAVAAGLEVLVLSLAGIVAGLQNVIVPLFYPNSSVMTLSGGKMVFPPGIVFTGMYAVFYLIYVVFIAFYNGKYRRAISVAVIALIFILGLISGVGALLITMFGARFGITGVYQAKLSLVNTSISLATMLPGLLVSPLFFISVGRFGISDPDMM
ncbi:MAG: hypothetical protein J5825_11210 [Lachnospiraceae bacterium]|nr:hypothetical protein [Lachnospiraceae bacterium]